MKGKSKNSTYSTTFGIDPILLCDSSKFGVRSARFFADLGVCDIIITDSSADPSFIEKLSAAGVVVK